MQVNIAGLIFTEEESTSGWVNRQVKDLRIKMPENFDKLESFSSSHLFECFHNLDIDVINAETRALHHSAFLFFGKCEVKEMLYQALAKFANNNDKEDTKLGG